MSVEFVTKIRGHCTGGDDLNLGRYPNLTYAPAQWGDGVRTHLAGKSVEDIAEHMTRYETAICSLDEHCAELGVTFDELLDALRYARANKLI